MKNLLLFQLLLILSINPAWRKQCLNGMEEIKGTAITFVQDDLKFIDGLPEDLNTSKVIFLKYDIIPVDAKDKQAIYYQKRHNKNTPDANKELTEAAKKYPFTYIIASRKDIDKLQGEGYKYVLDSEAFQNMSRGFRQDESHSITQGQARTKTITTVDYKLYFKEIGKSTAYVVSDELTENQLYFPKFVMNNMVLKKVNKKFK